MSTTGDENGFTREQLELTQLQTDAITRRLADNPVVQFMGIRLLEVVAGRATLMLPFRKELFNSMGSVQGGVLGILGDVAGGVSLYSVLADPSAAAIPTIEFKLNFLRPVRNNAVFARGKVAFRGGRIAVCHVDICTETDTLLAIGIFTYMVKTARSK
ncbi:MAG: PaaI family thioesterase [Deltaproteobacteria bacterium]|nr:MAG: PaaI family thioesterase [Deltaproteobacteria bacterium]